MNDLPHDDMGGWPPTPPVRSGDASNAVPDTVTSEMVTSEPVTSETATSATVPVEMPPGGTVPTGTPAVVATPVAEGPVAIGPPHGPPLSWDSVSQLPPIGTATPMGPLQSDNSGSGSVHGPRHRVVRALAGVFAGILLLVGGVLAGLVLSDNADDEVSDVPVSAVIEQPEEVAAQPPPETPVFTIPVQPGPVADDAAEPVAAVAAAVAPAVVRIETEVGTGTGIIYDESGLLVTNAHVVGDFEDVVVQLADGTRTEGTVVGVDSAVDVAVVQIDATLSFGVAVFAPTSTVEVGQLAVAIGSPFGLDQSVTAGIVSAVNRAISNTNVADGTPTVVEMVQTDAPINPGNSGGALADRQGRVIGMNTSIRTDGTVQGNLGVGFAIPSDTVILVAGRIVNGEPLDSGFLGISGNDPVTGPPGALIIEVVPGTPAESAGLEVGDLIVSIDGSTVGQMTELAAKVRIASPGTEVSIEVVRDGETVTVLVVLGTLGDS